MNYWRAHLNQTLMNITSEYDALMYGGKAITQIGQKFQEPSPAASFISPAFTDMFFKSDICFRSNQSTCYAPNSTWYQATRNGLNSMMMRCLEELSLLIQDDNSVISYKNPRYQAWYYIGITDLYDGIQVRVLAGHASAPDVLSPLLLPFLTTIHTSTHSDGLGGLCHLQHSKVQDGPDGSARPHDTQHRPGSHVHLLHLASLLGAAKG